MRALPPAISLRVGVSAAVARTIAANFLMPVLTVDRCRPSVRTGDFSELLRDLRSHDIDLVVGESELLEGARQDLEVVVLHRPALVAICAPNVTPQEGWENVSLLEYRPSSIYHWEVARFLDERSLRPKPMGDLDDAFLMLEAVALGGFVAFVPRSIARDAIKSGRVKELASFAPTGAGVHAIFHSSEGDEVVRDAVAKLIENARATLDER